MICTFFGHSDAPQNISNNIKNAILSIIKDKGVNKFYIGNHGNFDNMVIKILKELVKANGDLQFYIVLAYLPQKRDSYRFSNDITIYPEELEKVPKRFAILERNKWMLNQSDYIITYVRHIGNAKFFKELAENRGKIIIEL